MNNLIIKAKGHYYNEYPNLCLIVNNQVIFNEQIINQKFVIPLNSCNTNTIQIKHYDKYFGKNGRWDTKTINGSIVEDRKIEIEDILIDDLSFKTAFGKFKFIQNPQDDEPIINEDVWDGFFNFNGSVTLNINGNPLSWLTNLLYKKPISNLSSFSDHSKLFHYEEDLVLIEEIEKCLRELR